MLRWIMIFVIGFADLLGSIDRNSLTIADGAERLVEAGTVAQAGS